MVKPKKEQQQQLYTSCSIDDMEPSLARHLHHPLVQGARFDKKTGKYNFIKHGRMIACGGLLRHIKRIYYKSYKDNRSRRNYKKTNVKGSNKRQGKTVDQQIARSIERKVQKPHPMTRALLEHFKAKGHVLQAGQVPVELNGWSKMTQADLITRDKKTGKLWVWEIKTGMPVGFFVKQGCFKAAPLKDVECTKLNIWHLQLRYTVAALQASHVQVGESRVIQIYEDKERGLVIKEHEPPEWVAKVGKIV
jgi:hypothetical protein